MLVAFTIEVVEVALTADVVLTAEVVATAEIVVESAFTTEVEVAFVLVTATALVASVDVPEEIETLYAETVSTASVPSQSHVSIAFFGNLSRK